MRAPVRVPVPIRSRAASAAGAMRIATSLARESARRRTAQAKPYVRAAVAAVKNFAKHQPLASLFAFAGLSTSAVVLTAAVGMSADYAERIQSPEWNESAGDACVLTLGEQELDRRGLAVQTVTPAEGGHTIVLQDIFVPAASVEACVQDRADNLTAQGARGMIAGFALFAMGIAGLTVGAVNENRRRRNPASETESTPTEPAPT